MYELSDDSQDYFSQYKTLNAIPTEFDEKAEADKYEAFATTSADYTSRELSLVQMEIERRQEPLYAN